MHDPRSTTPVLRDPTTKYPRPPYPEQTQPWPGLAARMQPRPDHGETSYVGSGRLTGRRALITGGDSGMGRAAAIAFAREGADVAINYLPHEEEDAREVIALIGKTGRIGLAPAICATSHSARAWCTTRPVVSAASTSSSAMPPASKPTPRSWTSPARNLTR
jgi:hypothetical protein